MSCIESDRVIEFEKTECSNCKHKNLVGISVCGMCFAPVSVKKIHLPDLGELESFFLDIMNNPRASNVASGAEEAIVKNSEAAKNLPNIPAEDAGLARFEVKKGTIPRHKTRGEWLEEGLQNMLQQAEGEWTVRRTEAMRSLSRHDRDQKTSPTNVVDSPANPSDPTTNMNLKGRGSYATNQVGTPSIMVEADVIPLDEPAKMSPDEWLARQLQIQFNREVSESGSKIAHREEEDAMAFSSFGRAWNLTKHILAFNTEANKGQQGEHITPLATDDIVFIAQRFIAAQEDFSQAGKNTHIRVYFHFTKQRHLDAIRQDGLMNATERAARDGHNRVAGAAYFGQGIYTANNPQAFSHFGDIGLFVAVLKGNTRRVVQRSELDNDSTLDCGIGNKRMGRRHLRQQQQQGGTINDDEDGDLYNDEIVLRTTAQVLPLFQFSTNRFVQNIGLSNDDTIANLWDFADGLQKILDAFFNEGLETKIPRICNKRLERRRNHQRHHGMPSLSMQRGGTKSAPNTAGLNQLGSSGVAGNLKAPPSNNLLLQQQNSPISACTETKLVYTAPTNLVQSTAESIGKVFQISCSNQICPICMDDLSSQCSLQLFKCGHEFHKACMLQALQKSAKCPTCRADIVEPQGKSPSGTMHILPQPLQECAGFVEYHGSFTITYDLQSGTQHCYHDNPGQRYRSTRRVAYVPGTSDGVNLVKRLKYAFMHGLSFSVGTSITSGAKNVITWSSVHHKTSLIGGAHGFPDPNYIVNCNKELDALNVPPAADLNS